MFALILARPMPIVAPANIVIILPLAAGNAGQWFALLALIVATAPGARNAIPMALVGLIWKIAVQNRALPRDARSLPQRISHVPILVHLILIVVAMNIVINRLPDVRNAE